MQIKILDANNTMFACSQVQYMLKSIIIVVHQEHYSMIKPLHAIMQTKFNAKKTYLKLFSFSLIIKK